MQTSRKKSYKTNIIQKSLFSKPLGKSFVRYEKRGTKE